MTSAAQKPRRQALEPGDPVADRYVVRRVLGEGGMGQVLEVEHRALGRAFALKVLRLEKWNDELVRRFNREARALARITTPRVAQVTDFGVDAQAGPFYVMELIEGETLEARIEREERLAPRDALAVCAEVCDALAEVHAAGIVHRDLKPSNVGLPARGPVGVKLLDFGLAASLDEAFLSKITQSQQILGSLPYMAPEQFNAAEPAVSMDVYALGVVLYEALTGRLPFNAPSTAALIHQILATPIPPLAPELEGRALIEPLLERLLAKEPHQRFASAAAAGQALREVLGALGARAHPATRASDARVPQTVEAASEMGYLPTVAMAQAERPVVESGTRLQASAAPGGPWAPHAAVAAPSGRRSLHLVGIAALGVALAAIAGVVFVIAAATALRTSTDAPPPAVAPTPSPSRDAPPHPAAIPGPAEATHAARGAEPSVGGTAVEPAVEAAPAESPAEAAPAEAAAVEAAAVESPVEAAPAEAAAGSSEAASAGRAPRRAPPRPARRARPADPAPPAPPPPFVRASPPPPPASSVHAPASQRTFRTF